MEERIFFHHVENKHGLINFRNKKQTKMEKQIYLVKYFGNATKYQDLHQTIAAHSKREAVERFYAQMLNEDYFPEDEFTYGGLIRDCDGNVIAEPGSESIEYDGGHFYAKMFIA